MQEKKLFLLDAMALIYRAYFALSKNPRITSKGFNTSAVMGFTNSLYDILKNENPTHIGVAFDSFAPTLRHQEYAEYKANREKMPEDIISNLPYIKKLLEGFRIPVIEMEGYEADDLIGTLAKQAEKEGFTTYMMTPDKDFAQLVSEKIFLYKPARMGNKAEVMGIKEVCEKFGVQNTDQVRDILGLWGDASDNIPGIPGVGEKTAKKLLEEFPSVEELVKNAHKLKNPRMQEKVAEHGEQAIKSKELATIITDAPVTFNDEEYTISDPDQEALKALFDELEFKTFAKRFFGDNDPAPATATDSAQTDLFSSAGEHVQTIEDKYNTIETTKHQYYSISTKEELLSVIEKLKAAGHFCFDTETTSIDANRAELAGISFSIKPHEAWYLYCPENYDECMALIEPLKPLFEDEKIRKTGQNIKYDINVLKWYDIDVKGVWFDTMIAHYLLEPDQRHNMDFLAQTYLNYDPVSIETLIGKKGKTQKSIRNADPEKVAEYGAEDADITLQLQEVFAPRLKEDGVEDLFREIEMPLVPVLAEMEATGVKLDIENMKAFSHELAVSIREIEKEIYSLAGAEFNIASPKQLGVILFERLKITDKPKRTKTKQYSTSEDVLAKLVNKHPIVEKILEYRSLTKLKSTYVDALPALVNPRTGRIHTNYNQAVAATGRLSSNNPNLQNIPIRTERGREIRKAFVPGDEEHTLLAADYSQIELRIIAALSKDEAMCDAFKNNFDIHTATAARIFGVEHDDVTKEMRRNAKTVNFGIVYGISAFGLSERLNIPRKEAAEIINQYFEKYPGIKKYMEDQVKLAKERGYVETIMKRRRYLKDIHSGNAVVRGFAERNAINAPIQGSSADMIKIAMIRIHKEMKEKNLKSKMILQVHDELVFDVYKPELEVIKELVTKNMTEAMDIGLPLDVEMATGTTWLEAH
ncbi:MAG: DNA polymerase I [Marinilabiliales bacterium]|nr:MAG: DNA polymerase I [Marinilabiliales bacterium]